MALIFGLSTKTVLFVHLDGEDLFAPFGPAVDDLMAMDPAPCRNIIQCAGVGAGYCQEIAVIQTGNLILGPDNWHRTQQICRVEMVIRHAILAESRLLAGVRRLVPYRYPRRVSEC